MAIQAEMTVHDAIQGSEARAKVLDLYGIDTCCGGKVSLRLACERRGLDLQIVMQALAAAETPAVTDQATESVSALNLQALTDHLEETHHRFLRERLPRLVELAYKVANRHGSHRPNLVHLARLVDRFHTEMIDHLDKEERVLFPFCRQLEADPGQLTMPPMFVVNPIRVMTQEHGTATDDLRQMRVLTEDYRIPDDACNSYRALLLGLAEMDDDTQAHLRKEDDLLFPKATELAQAVGR